MMQKKHQTPLIAKLIRQCIQLKKNNHFLVNYPDSRKAFKLQCELQNRMSGYRELYEK